MKKYIIGSVLGIIIGGGVILNFVAPIIARETPKNVETYISLNRFGEVFERIKKEYVEEASTDELIDAAIDGMLVSLDPHSSYISPKEFAKVSVETQGEFGGLGIEITQEDGFIKVVSPIDGTPAALAGIQAGDFITKVDGKNLLGLTIDESIDLMRGPVGTEVTITVSRPGQKDHFDVKIVRDTIRLRAVKGRIEDGIIYLRIASFSGKVYLDLKDNFDKRVEELGGIKKVKGVVLDLRNNPGGLLKEAIEVSDAFLSRGEIVSTRGRHENSGTRFNAKRGDIAKKKPMVILINSGSASASEIVAGALQDHKRALIVGTKSFGKGSVQTLIPLDNNGAMRLTTARYYTPSGRSIQGLGILPDIVVKQQKIAEDEKNSQSNALIESEADLRGSISNDSLTNEERQDLLEKNEKNEASSDLKRTDYQLAYALDMLRAVVTFSEEQK